MIGVETVTVLPAGEWDGTTRDRYGKPVLTPSAEYDVHGCAVAPRASSEDNAGRTGVIVGLTVYAPPGTRVAPSDRVRVRGVVYGVEGEPGVWVFPWSGEEQGVEVALARTEG